MRIDVKERMIYMKKEGIKPNYAEIGRVYDCDYRTAKKFYENNNQPSKRMIKPSKLDDYKEIIIEKINMCCTAKAILKFIEKKGYKGKYSILRDFIKKYKDEEIKKATMRFETNPGLQAQVDWKEELTMASRSGELFEINIFLILLGYSRIKYMELTLDRTQDTLMQCMINSFVYFGGVPKEILFDNMKTVIDKSKTIYQDAVVNETFYEFSKDMGFEVRACRVFRPQTKGKVEACAKLTSRLAPYNKEFDTFDELIAIVKDVVFDINTEISTATHEKPIKLLEKEREYLHPLPKQSFIDNYFTKPIQRIVTKESMITYMNNKYSLDVKYIGKTVNLEVEGDKLLIIFNNKIIQTHTISNKKFNYKEEDLIRILKSDAMKHKTEDEIEEFAKIQLKIYDSI